MLMPKQGYSCLEFEPYVSTNKKLAPTTASVAVRQFLLDLSESSHHRMRFLDWVSVSNTSM
jgi:hypothetical protein